MGLQVAEDAAAEPAHNVAELGDVVRREGVRDLAAEVEQHHQDEGQGQLALVEVGERGQEYHHKDDARGPHEAGREQKNVEDPGHQGRDRDHDGHAAGAVVRLEYRPEEQYEGEIRQEVVEVRVPEDVAHEPDIIPDRTGIEAAASGHGEPGFGEPMEKLIEEQDERAYEREGQGSRRVVLDGHGLPLGYS